MILWEVVLVTTATAVVAVSGQINEQEDLRTGLIQEKNDLNIIDQKLMSIQDDSDNSSKQQRIDLSKISTIEQDDLDTNLMQEQVDMTVGVMLLNKTGLARISEKKSVTDHLKKRADRKKSCSPTSSCTLAGGHCFNSGEKCNGTVDSYGCIGGKNCMCCIPDKNATQETTCPDTTTSCPACATVASPSCPICPEATCAPHPTSSAVTTSTILTTTPRYTETTTIPTTTPPVTTSTILTTTPRYTETTTVPTTTPPGSTLNPNLNWLRVGADRFVKHNNTMSWSDARAVCRSDGLDLYEPRNILAVSKYLDENHFSGSSSVYFWLGGRANGTHQVWFSGSVVPSNAPWYGSYASSKGTNHCMLLFTSEGNADKGTVLASYNCLDASQMRPLCG